MKMGFHFLILALFIRPVTGIQHLRLNILTGIILQVKLSSKFICYQVRHFYISEDLF